MKKLLLSLLLFGASKYVYSQATGPIGNAWAAGKFLGFNASSGVNPLYTRTNNINRMKLNGSVAYAVNGFPGARNGYLLLGDGSGLSAPLFTGATTGAYSQLHLTGNDGAFIPSGGYRPWMKTGITLTDNQDLSYFGVRNVLLDVNETVIAWSDNAGTSGSGPDDMVFRFLSGAGGTISTTDLVSDADLDGLHIARFTGIGNFGLGNTFGSPVGPLYVTPQSLAHYSLSNLRSVWQQFTNRNVALGSGTSETASDGLRIGIIGNTNLNVNGTAAIYNQENRHLLFSTNANTTTMNVLTGNTLERMRITSVGTQTNLPIGGYGVYNPGLLGTNLTRVAISHNPAQPVTRPLSLLHLGYNTGLISSIVGATDGWRSWMDIGTFTTNGTDNIYVGLKNEGTDRFDAVINWGDNQVSGLTANDGPDHLRFIFTSTTTSITGPGDSISQSLNGLETGRFYPGYDTTFSYLLSGPLDLYGRFGVGDFTASGVNEEPTHKLDVIGNGRFRYLPDSLYLADSLVNKYVMVDSMGVLRWSSISPGGFGASCSDTINGKLNFDTKLDLNNYNLYFTNNDSLGQNHVGVGFDCGVNLPGKISVWQTHPDTINTSTLTYYGRNNDLSNTNGTTQSVFYGISDGVQPIGIFSMNQGAYLEATNSRFNMGILAYANGTSVPISNNTAGAFRSVNGAVGMGVNGTSVGAINNNFGVLASANGGVNSYGIYAAASGSSSTNTAGFFVGDVVANGNYLSTSDQQFKVNIVPVESALKIVSNLNPKAYYFDTINFTQFNFGSEKQYGFIAQEVEMILPELVQNSYHPGEYDTLGTLVVSATNYKSLNYNAIIPINTQAIKELNAKVDRSTLSDETLKENVSDLTGSLDKVLEMRGVNYSWSQNGQDNYGLDSSSHIGFLAQEINQIDPLLTFVDSDTLMHVRYDKVVPIITESIKELNTKIEMKDSIINAQGDLITDLNDRLTQLENCLSGILPFLCQMSNSAIQPTQEEVQNQLRTAINVNLSDRNAIVLNQNVPNPFAESTVITYSIPTSVQKAQIHFYDGQGKLINSVDVIERGNGQLNVFANDLSSGVYTYSLVADGQVVATKRMMKQ
jgi:hypothetical protein